MNNRTVSVTIYHNPACGTSRHTLALIRDAGIEPRIIEYLKTPPGREMLVNLLRSMGVRPRDILREKGKLYSELKLYASHWTDDELIDFMVQHPILMNRPIVVTPLGVKLCRPPASVMDLLPD